MAASAMAYTVLKVVGAGYVVYLGVQAIRHRGDARLALDAGLAEPERRGRSVITGFVVGVTNPKTIVFFVAFLPQFAATGAPAGPQLALLGVVFGGLCVLSDGAWALAAGTARTWFVRRPERLDGLGVAGGVMMIALGTGMAAQQ
ncbi:LysE family translocator [Nocardioides sp. GXZ039]|uniref:LysE family translocator n=1 Tax=Nocardioides sp. GXZ039 TaxID=3136018 RepID=UPI0030F3A2CB